MKRLRSGILIFLLILFSIFGLSRLQFATDILEVLPRGIKGVEALKIFRENFDEDQQVIALLKTQEDEIYEEDVALIAEDLRMKLPEAMIEYKSSFEENPEAFAKALARIWTYAPTDLVDSFTQKLRDQNQLRRHLEKTKQEIRDSFDQSAAVMASYDPLGFLKHPAIEELTQSDYSYQNEEGTSHLLLISTSNLTAGYKEHAAWVEKIRSLIDASIEENELNYTYSLTGGPVYSSEIGSGMEQDMTGTIALTSILVGVLFLLVQKNIGQLLMIVTLLGFTFLVTLGLGGWIFGTLNLVSVGFAAILLGLVIDYAIVIARESKEGDDSSIIRKRVAPSILWAAFTTALVFGLLTFSTFTGVRQLGGLIVIGLIVGAFTMLGFTPLFLKRFPTKPAKQLTSPIFFSPKIGIFALLFALIFSFGIFFTKGTPKIVFDLSMVEPTSSEAAQTFEEIKQTYPAWSDDNLQVIASAGSMEELHSTTKAVTQRLKELQRKQIIQEFQWPDSLAPDTSAFHSNKDSWMAVSQSKNQILQTLKDVGFSERGTALDEAILNELTGELFDTISVHDSTSDDLVGLFFKAGNNNTFYFSGRLRASKPIDAVSFQTLRSIEQDDVTLTGWPALQAMLLPMVKRDFYMIFLPAAFVLLIALLIVFRSWKDALLSISILLCVLAVANALVVTLGQSWNFLSGMAIPLIVGTGIDYSIHLIFSLRRNQGNLEETWNGVGKAIMFCGLSTAIGFASLLFASNEMLKSMGMLCSIGVILTASLSVLVIPGLWKWSHRRRLGHS